MNLHTAPEDRLLSTSSHDLFSGRYEEGLCELFSKLPVLENTLKIYRAIPLVRKTERIKQSAALFRIYWQSILKMLLPGLHNDQFDFKHLLMRYGLLSLDDVAEDDLSFLHLIPLHANSPNGIYYMDEWLSGIATGKLSFLQQEKRDKSKESQYNSLDLIRESSALEALSARICKFSGSTASPFLHRNDLSHPLRQQLASREAVHKVIGLVRNIDPNVFRRKLLKEEVNIEPYVILVPGYAELGACLEAFDRLERNSSPGRIVVPLYAPNTQEAVLVALADYRWETAKLAAGGYWLEKGLTGGFYDLYRKLSLPGNGEKSAFISAYCQWVLDESRGQIKMAPELRSFFWQEIPFAEERRKTLLQHFPHFQDI